MKTTTEKNISQKGWLFNFLAPLMRAGLPLIKNILTSLAISVLTSLTLTTAASATDAAIQKNS